ncbi:hypothetical protein AB0J35_56995 [Nonomuraea angiospora]|uniref:hypothetical protein n=1 Tax=Nonomuraea angiospora TaxID=46172 RepID=UPI00341A548A
MSNTANESTPATSPPDEGVRISQKALSTIAWCVVGVVALWTAVQLAKLGADPAVLVPILKVLKI